MAAIGALSLLVGAFVETLHDYETVLTLIGATLLIIAHLARAQNIRVSMNG